MHAEARTLGHFAGMILKHNEHDRFSSVLREWEGGTAVLLGGGPSLDKSQAALVRKAHGSSKCHVIAINDSYLLAPWADVLYAADSRWWDWHAAGIAKPLLNLTAGQVRERYESFSGERCSIQYSGANITDKRVHILRNKTFPDHGVGLSLDQGALVTGRNSGFQGINLASLAGAKRIILLGIDGKIADDGRSHFHGGHPSPTPFSLFFEQMRKTFSAAERAIKEAGVEVLNCSPGSAIDSFPKMKLEAVL